MSRPNELSDSVKRSLERYFKDMDGEKPTSIYEMVLKNVEKPMIEMVLARVLSSPQFIYRIEDRDGEAVFTFLEPTISENLTRRVSKASAGWIKTTQVGTVNAWTSPGITGIEDGGADNDVFWGFIDNTGRIGVHRQHTVLRGDRRVRPVRQPHAPGDQRHAGLERRDRRAA